MKLNRKLTAAVAAAALGVTPAIALAHGNPHPGNPPYGKGHTTTTSTTTTSTTTTTGTTTSPYSVKGNGYGVRCHGLSKTHIKGQKGTPFSQCVVALAHAQKHPKTNPAKLCATESKRHVKGEKGTPFSDCVKAAAKLEHQTRAGTTATPVS